MQIKAEAEILEKYKYADQITKYQIWMRFPAFRKAFDEIDGNAGNKWQVPRAVPRADWYKKEK
jgi:hypothetical protein